MFFFAFTGFTGPDLNRTLDSGNNNKYSQLPSYLLRLDGLTYLFLTSLFQKETFEDTDLTCERDSVFC